MKLGDHVTHIRGWAGIVSRITIDPGLTVDEADWPAIVLIDLGPGTPGGRWLSIGGTECDGIRVAKVN